MHSQQLMHEIRLCNGQLCYIACVVTSSRLVTRKCSVSLSRASAMSSMSKAVWFDCASSSLSACDVGAPWHGDKGEEGSTIAACGCCDRPLPLLRGSLLPAVAGYKQFASKRRQAPHVGRVSSHCSHSVSVIQAPGDKNVSLYFAMCLLAFYAAVA